MELMTDPDQPATTPSQDPETVEQMKRVAAANDDTVAASFPASDPPAVWTWEVPRTERARRG
jgi:hypothetical protein